MIWYNVCIIWYDTLEDMTSLRYDICLTWLDIWYDRHAIWCISIMHNLDICMESMIKWYDTKEGGRGVVVHDNERKNVGTSCIIHCMFMHRGIPLLLRWYGCVHYEAEKRSLYLL